MASKHNFEVLGLVEKNLYIKSKEKQFELEKYLTDNNLDISIYYS